MRFEKLNENKIRIILQPQDLESNNIDYHSFMANPIDSQNLFFDMLKKAEKEIGFVTENYNIRLEAIQVAGGDFVLTITRSLPDNPINSQDLIKKNLKVKRKKMSLSNSNSIYCFNCFEDFCDFSNSMLNSEIDFDNIAKNISLYEYKERFFLVFSNINLKNNSIKSIFSHITEFATYVNNSDLFKRNLVENGKIIMKNNAIRIAIKYFA